MKCKKSIVCCIKAICIILFGLVLFLCKAETVYADSVEENSEAYIVDNNGQLIAYYYKLTDGGYILIDSKAEKFIEYSFEYDRLNLEAGCIYTYDNISNDAKKGTNRTELCGYSNIKGGLSNQANAIVSQLYGITVIEENYLRYSTYNFSYYPEYGCGAVAFAIVLRYYHDYIDSGFIVDNNLLYYNKWYNYDGRNIISYLYDNYFKGGTDYYTQRSAMIRYLRDINKYNRVFIKNKLNDLDVYKRIKSKINSNQPLIVGLIDPQHWVVATGYRVVWSNSLGVGYIVETNYGNGNTGVFVNLSNIDGCVYID